MLPGNTCSTVKLHACLRNTVLITQAVKQMHKGRPVLVAALALPIGASGRWTRSYGACPGMACMWASTHRHDAQAPPGQPQQAAANGTAANETATDATDGAPHSADCDTAVLRHPPLQPTSSHVERSSEAGNGSGTHGLPLGGVDVATSQLLPAAPNAAAKAAVTGLLKEALLLPAPECLRPELNAIDKDLQNVLRCSARSDSLCVPLCDFSTFAVGPSGRFFGFEYVTSWDLHA